MDHRFPGADGNGGRYASTARFDTQQHGRRGQVAPPSLTTLGVGDLRGCVWPILCARWVFDREWIGFGNFPGSLSTSFWRISVLRPSPLDCFCDVYGPCWCPSVRRYGHSQVRLSRAVERFAPNFVWSSSALLSQCERPMGAHIRGDAAPQYKHSFNGQTGSKTEMCSRPLPSAV